MAIGKKEFEAIESVEDWYVDYKVQSDGTLWHNGLSACAQSKKRQLAYYKAEMDQRVGNHWKYEKIADAAIVTERADLPNVSSGEAAGFIRRIARSVVQHTPNITITSIFDDDSAQGIIAKYIAVSKIIGDDEYSNNMQQMLYATMIRGAAIGFDCVVPALLRNHMGTWYTQYDNINYRDVFPEPGVKDVRRATYVYVRRYLTRGEVHSLINTKAPGWDQAALKSLLETSPGSREYVDHQSKKHRVNSDGYEIITWYSNTGEAFLTWAANSDNLLRIEKNKHPLKEHPVHFFVPEYDGQQPFGRSVLSLIYGRQEFQDWFLNGAMKLWRLNIEPPIIGYGVVNSVPNIGPGKYTSIPNPKAKVEAFQVNSNSLNMFGQISQQNAANMQQLIGAADQQMASQTTAGMMSQTAAGVDAQTDMVDITTNNYQKALEAFFSRYVSYALTVYFQELKSLKKLIPSSEARVQMINAGIDPEAFLHEGREEQQEQSDGTMKLVTIPPDGTNLKDGEVEADFSKLAVQYFVKTVPGSLTELEDEKQIRLLNQMFIPLSQAMPAVAQAGDQQTIQEFSAAMRFIVRKQIELSGSAHSQQLKEILSGNEDKAAGFEARAAELEERLEGARSELAESMEMTAKVLQQIQDQNIQLAQAQGNAGGQNPSSAPGEAGAPAPVPLPVPAPV